jgi:hypothetical protein
MTCEEFLKKWSFLPPIRYSDGLYTVKAYYIKSSLYEENEDLYQLLKNIDAQMEEKATK